MSLGVDLVVKVNAAQAKSELAATAAEVKKVAATSQQAAPEIKAAAATESGALQAAANSARQEGAAVAAVARQKEQDTARAAAAATRASQEEAASLQAAVATETGARAAAAESAHAEAAAVTAAAHQKEQDATRAAAAAARAAQEEAAARQAAASSYSALRAQFDPLYAASMRYAQAVEVVDAAVKAGAVSQEQANRVLKMAETEYLAITPKATAAARSHDLVTTASAGVAKGSRGVAYEARMVAQQLSQVAQQGAVTGDYLGALAIQLPDIGLGFGGVGIAAGVLAMVALPLITSAFTQNADAIEASSKANQAYRDSFDALKSDLAAVTGLEADYTAALQSGSAERIASIKAEATIREKILELDQIEASSKRETAAAALQVVQQQFLAAQSEQAIAQNRMDRERDLRDAALATVQAVEARLAAAKAAGGDIEGEQQNLDIAKAKYEAIKSQLEASSEALIRQNDALQKQNMELDKASREYQLNNALMEANNDKVAANKALLERIAADASTLSGHVSNTSSAFASAASNAGTMNAALSAAVGFATSLRGEIDGLNFNNIAAAAENAALRAGKSPNEAKATGKIAGSSAQLASIRGSSDGIIRALAPNSKVDALNAAVLEQGRQADEHAALIAAWNKAHQSGAGGSAKVENDLRSLTSTFDGVTEAANKYAKAQETIAAAVKAGEISQAQANVYLAEAKVQMDNATEAAMRGTDVWATFKGAAGDAIDKLIAGTGNLKSALRDMLKEMELALIKGALLGHVTGGEASDSIGSLLVKGIFGGFKAEGGMVWGQGGARDDRVMIATSPGEFVVNGKATAANRPLLEFINGGGRFADGGMVGVQRTRSDPARTGRERPAVGDIHIHGASGDAQIREMVAQGVQAGLRAYDRDVLPTRVPGILRDPRAR